MFEYQIKANGKNITNQIKPYLISIQINDVIGDKADTVKLILTDENGLLALPTTGVSLNISIFEHNQLVSFGSFVVDEVCYRQVPTTIEVSATSISFDQSSEYQAMHSQKTRSFSNKRLKDIIAQIANEHKLDYSVSDELGHYYIKHIEQINESNLAFLRRLSREQKSDFKLTYRRILFYEKDAKTVSNQSITPMNLNVSELNSICYKVQKRNHYNSIIVSYYHLDQAEVKEVIIGSGEPIYRATYVYESKEKALAIAKKILSEQQNKSDNLTFSMPGNLFLRAGQPIEIKGLKESIPNKWLLTEVNHQFEISGYVVTVKAKLSS
ncbi:hypothetical protein L3V83_05360 [Thiotrichales bacterium 19X7-9]|nr:hypothetical protein [Thiotrichales bacterium 19X7-9]